MSGVSSIDVAVIVAYLIGITVFGIVVGYRRRTSSDEYFLAGKSLGWFTVGAAIFTSNISTIHLVGLAAGGAADGLVIGNFEWMACVTLVLLALVFVPFYVSSGVRTLPEFMERRYCPAARTFLAIVGLLGALLIHIGISLFAAAKLFESFLGVPMAWSILVLSALTVAYTALGGLKAVVMTETVQVCLLLAGAILVTVLSVRALPAAGVHNLAELQAALPAGRMHMLQPVFDARGELNEYSWLGVVLGYPILGIWYWCADQTLVQRVLGARDQPAAQKGALFAGFLKITPVFLMVFPGIVGCVLWQRGAIQLPNVAGTNEPDYNAVFPVLVNHLVPMGLKGLLAGGLAAALMSSIAAALNSCATLVSFDIVKRARPQMADGRVVAIGRVTTGAIMVLAMLWSTQGSQFGTIFEAINKIPMTFAPAVTTVFLLGVLWRRGTATAAVATLGAGSLLGVIYFIVDLPRVGALFFGADGAPDGFRGLVSDPVHGLGVPFMLVGPLLAAVCVAIYVTTSLLTPPPDAAVVGTLCWDHPLAFLRGRRTAGADPRRVALLLLIVVGTLYWLLR